MLTYFGPVTSAPSWHWVGQDIAEKLATERSIRYFRHADDLPDDCIAVWIKSPPDAAALPALLRKRVRILFFPVDYFIDPGHIDSHRRFLEFCHAIVLHSDSLRPYFDSGKIRCIDHYNKYGINPKAREPGKELIWIGGFQYVPYIVKFLLETGLNKRRDIVLLSDHGNPSARRAACTLAGQLGMGQFFSERSVAGLARLEAWSVRRQAFWLRTCAAAFDIKDTSNFNQFHKPPTKLQKYICSGIAPAINGGMPLASAITLRMPEPGAIDQWLGDDYQKQVAALARELRDRLSLESIARRYSLLIRETELQPEV